MKLEKTTPRQAGGSDGRSKDRGDPVEEIAMDQAPEASDFDMLSRALANEVQNLRNQRDQVQGLLNEQRQRIEVQRQLTRDRENEILSIMGGVRYRIGDTFVQSASNRREALKLPGRLYALYREGRENVLERSSSDPEPAPSATVGYSAAPTKIPEVRPLPESLRSIEPDSELEEPFSQAPKERIARPELRIAGVMDEFSWRCWQYEADLFTFTPDDWKAVLGAKNPHFLFVESTWHGVGGAWSSQLDYLGTRPDMVERYVLPDMVAWCKERGIPTVFYNKEDPPDFECFIDSAKLFDHIFTSDANCIPKYCESVGHDRVYALPFAAQPRIHRPPAGDERFGSVCFAGAWYRKRHTNRRSGADTILEPALDFDLVILDRMAGTPDPDYQWPESYQPYVYGSLPYSQMVEAYRKFKVFLNINSVVDSPTMFSRRVFELLASGTPVISSPSLGIEELLGEGTVLISESGRETRRYLSRLLADNDYWAEVSERGKAAVLSAHTYQRRLTAILKRIGIRFLKSQPEARFESARLGSTMTSPRHCNR